VPSELKSRPKVLRTPIGGERSGLFQSQAPLEVSKMQ